MACLKQDKLSEILAAVAIAKQAPLHVKFPHHVVETGEGTSEAGQSLGHASSS